MKIKKEQVQHARDPRWTVGGVCVLLCTAVAAGILMISGVTMAQAGEINANEARLVRAASGTFKHEGKKYRASAQYVDELRSYLSQDDVDLTSADVDSLISDMNANVAAGVQDGYLEELGGESGEADLEEAGPTEDKAGETSDDGSEESDEEQIAADEKKEESDAGVEEGSVDAADSEPKQPLYTVEETPEETQIVATDGSVIFSAAPMIKAVGYHNRTMQGMGIIGMLMLTGITGGTFMVIRNEKA